MKYSIIFALAAAANAHMVMLTPKPFASPNNSPLDSSGSDFPCKGSFGSSDPVNDITVGQAQTLSFMGSAVHGGGSCQISIAQGSGFDVNKDTKWMVIHSIEGGCPADTTSSGGGNLPPDASGSGAAKFQFTIPDHPDIPKGKAVLAWTWHNRIGNREMYMNCAAVNIAGGGAKKRYAPASYSKRQSSNFPAMFVANIGNGCATTEGVDVTYPNLVSGDSLEKGANDKPGAPVGSSCDPGRVGSGSTPGGSASASSAPSGAAQPSGGSSSPTANTIVPTSIAGSQSTSIAQTRGGGFATVSGSGAASAPAATASSAPVASSAASSAVASAPAASTPAASAPASPASSAPAAPVGTGTSSAPSTGSCNTGDWNCAADGNSFTRCIAGGTWSASIPMAQGMSCVPGISANFAYNLTGSHAKRDLRSHVMRSRRSLHAPALS